MFILCSAEACKGEGEAINKFSMSDPLRLFFGMVGGVAHGEPKNQSGLPLAIFETRSRSGQAERQKGGLAMFGHQTTTAATAAAREQQFAVARAASAASLAVYGERDGAEAALEELHREVEIYLELVDLLREVDHEPHWHGQ